MNTESKKSSNINLTMDVMNTAVNICSNLTGEKKSCESGVTSVYNALMKNNTPEQIIDMCTQYNGNQKLGPYSANTGFRQGCYLALGLAGPKDNLCHAKVPDMNGNTHNIPFICDKTCDTFYPSGSDDSKLSSCRQNASKNFHILASGGMCSAESMPCIDNINRSTNGFNCEKNHNDRLNQCLPTTVGCSVGLVQSGFLNKVQNYEKNVLGREPQDCRDYDSQYQQQHSHTKPTKMFPYGSTY